MGIGDIFAYCSVPILTHLGAKSVCTLKLYLLHHSSISAKLRPTAESCESADSWLSSAPHVVQFLSRPFVVGDRVDLSTGAGERVLVGVVERVDPMRTIIRTDACAPVTIPNKVSLQCSLEQSA